MQTVSAAALVQPDRVLRPGSLVFGADGRIEDASAAPVSDPSHECLLPGFVDLQVNGFAGIDLMTCAGEQLAELGTRLVGTGVTGFLATLISNPIDALTAQLAVLARGAEQMPQGAARMFGFHLEGPFLNPARRGAHLAEHVRPPSRDELARLLDAGAGMVRLVTLAPEVDGAGELIDVLVGRGVTVAAGHSDATYEEAVAAFDRGVTMCTHLGNAMSGIHQRAPGLPVACLDDERVSVCLIADLVHVHPGFLRLALRAKGPERVILVTDSIAAAGLPDGDYHLAGRKVRVEDGVCRDETGTMAGSTLRFDVGLARFARATGIAAAGLGRIAATNAARALGLDEEVGSLLPGRHGDAVAWWPDGERLVQASWIDGAQRS